MCLDVIKAGVPVVAPALRVKGEIIYLLNNVGRGRMVTNSHNFKPLR